MFQYGWQLNDQVAGWLRLQQHDCGDRTVEFHCFADF
jgi:hypothetical protein